MSHVSLLTRGSSTNGAGRAESARSVSSPPATRQRRSRWRDPRLWLGIVLVVGSVVAGAKVLASADDTVAVWQVVHDVPAGAGVDSGDLRLTQVHFAEPAVAAKYLSGSLTIGPGSHATRDLHAGEMLPSVALSSVDSPLRRQLPLGVSPAHAPADLHAGDHVEVWAVADGSDGTPRATDGGPAKVLPDVVVLSVGSSLSGVSGDRQVLVGLADDVDVGNVLRQVTGSQVVLVRLAG